MKKNVSLIFIIIVTVYVLFAVGCSIREYDSDDNLDDTHFLDTESTSTDLLVEYEQKSDFINGLAWITGVYNYYDPTSNYFGIIDTDGNLVIPLIYKDVFCFDYYTRGFVWVELAKNEKWGLIDTSNIEVVGNIVVPFIYDKVLSLNNEGWAMVMIGKKHGLLDEAGNVLVPVEYEQVFFYSDGVAAVMLGGKWGFIDSDNNVIAPFVYDYVSPFSNGLARVGISEDGNAFFPYGYSAPEQVWLKGKFGFIDMSGNVVIPIIYDYAYDSFDDDGLVSVELDDKYGKIDMSGNVIVPFE